jgi:hypothetical protein
MAGRLAWWYPGHGGAVGHAVGDPQVESEDVVCDVGPLGASAVHDVHLLKGAPDVSCCFGNTLNDALCHQDGAIYQPHGIGRHLEWR